MQLFYHSNIKGSTHELDRDESRHLVKVLRQGEGDKVFVTDGRGMLYECHISIADPSKCILTVDGVTQPSQPRVNTRHIAIAPTKNIDRFEWFIEKATEIGIDIITPILTEHSERKTIKPERIERVLVAAMKQSNRYYLPILKPVIRFDEFLHTKNTSTNCFIAHCYNEANTPLVNTYNYNLPGLVVIGPEGDFSIREVQLAERLGYKSISLGPNRLRTETAAIVACTLMCVESI